MMKWAAQNVTRPIVMAWTDQQWADFKAFRWYGRSAATHAQEQAGKTWPQEFYLMFLYFLKANKACSGQYRADLEQYQGAALPSARVVGAGAKRSRVDVAAPKTKKQRTPRQRVDTGELWFVGLWLYG
jgi:hypothetical protein